MLGTEIQDRISRGVGIIAAPWVFALSRLSNSATLAQAALRCDPSYLRAHQNLCQGGTESRVFFGQLTTAIELMAALNETAHPIIKESMGAAQAQLLQDILCLVVHRRKADGYFVEIGVGDGRSVSNTLLLESRGWSGLLVEPCRTFHEQIRARRSARLDTRAAGRTRGEATFYESVGAGEFSGFDREHASNSSKSAHVYSYTVTTASTDQILRENDAPTHIDYMSIDTEGSELDVLAGLDFDRTKVGFFTIEHNQRPGEVQAMRQLLGPRGYVQILERVSKWDAWFVHRSVSLEGIL